MKAVDIEKVIKVLRRSVPKHCHCWKCIEAKEAIELVEKSRQASRKKKINAKSN